MPVQLTLKIMLSCDCHVTGETMADYEMLIK